MHLAPTVEHRLLAPQIAQYLARLLGPIPEAGRGQLFLELADELFAVIDVKDSLGG